MRSPLFTHRAGLRSGCPLRGHMAANTIIKLSYSGHALGMINKQTKGIDYRKVTSAPLGRAPETSTSLLNCISLWEQHQVPGRDMLPWLKGLRLKEELPGPVLIDRVPWLEKLKAFHLPATRRSPMSMSQNGLCVSPKLPSIKIPKSF